MFWPRLALRRAAAALVPLAIAFTPAAASAAARTLTGSFPIVDHFVDDGTTAACGFDVTVDLVGTRSFEVGFDDQGNAIWLNLHTIRSGTVSGNGVTLPEMDRENQHFDLTSQALIDAGIVFRIGQVDGGAVALFDRGFIRVAPDGTIEQISGPHPALEGNVEGLCVALGA